MLVKIPNIYLENSDYPAATVSIMNKTTDVELVYMTDRKPVRIDNITTEYGDDRSDSMAAGVAVVQYGKNLSWARLVEASQSGDRKQNIPIRLKSISEIQRFPRTPYPFTVTKNGPVIEPEFIEADLDSKAVFKNIIRQRLEFEEKKDVILYIHGFNNSFEDAVYALNDVWHFTGRHGIPIVYSWPSGSGNLFGYFTDRESGEFSIFHLKETLRTLAEIDEIDNIHIIAHSRGTDVATTALRELIIEIRGSGQNPVEKLKIKNLILAAPDLDYGVVKQRLIAEKFGPAFGKITIYINEGDKALGISQWLMRGIRFGRMNSDGQGEREDRIFQEVRNVTFINVEDVNSFFGHGYFRKHPGALSDIVRVITTKSLPGSAERPLVHIKSNFWRLDKNYLLKTELGN